MLSVTAAGRAPALKRILHETFFTWLTGDVIHWGAALAFYALLSLGPVLILLVGISGLVLDARTAGATIVSELRPVLGARGATVAHTILREGSFPGFGSLPALGSLALLLITSTALFANLRGALNAIWSVRPVTGTLRNVLRDRLAAFIMILIVGALLLASVVLGAATAVLAPYLKSWIPGGTLLVHVLAFAVSTGVLWLACAATFRVLPDGRVAWPDVWVGALATALLFVIGKFLIGLYLAHSNLASPYGAAGSVFLFLVWVYYSAQIFIFGATFTAAWARARGRSIRPKSYAARVTTHTEPPSPT